MHAAHRFWRPKHPNWLGSDLVTELGLGSSRAVRELQQWAMYWTQCVDQINNSNVILSRFGHTATIVDTSDNWEGALLVVHGGVGAPSGETGATVQTALSDVIVLHFQRSIWTSPDVIGPATPGPRAFHSAAAVGRHIYVFGGHILTFDSDRKSKQRTFFNDLWQLDTSTWQWQQVAPSSTIVPPKRDMSAMAAVSPTQLLLFGGRNEAGRSLADTWLFDLTSKTWSQAQLEGPPPPPRRMHAIAQVGSTLVMWGGERDNGPLDDLWLLRWSGAGETHSPRAQHTAAAAAAAAAITAGSIGGPLRWVSVKPKTGPGPRFGHALAALPGDAQQLLLFGGCQDQSGFLSLVGRNYVQTKEAWGLDLAKISWQQLDIRTGTDGSVAATPGTSPRATAAATAATATAAASTGGGTTTATASPSRGHSRTSSSSSMGRNLQMLAPPAAGGRSGPTERMCHSLTRCPDGRLLLLGGRNKDGICRDHWWLQEAALISSPPSPTPPTPSGPAPTTTTTPGSNTADPPAPSPASAAPSLLLSLFSQSRQKSATPAATTAALPTPPPATPAATVAATAAAAAVGSSGSPRRTVASDVATTSLTPASSFSSLSASLPAPAAAAAWPSSGAAQQQQQEGAAATAPSVASTSAAATATTATTAAAIAAATDWGAPLRTMIMAPMSLSSKLGTTMASTMNSTVNTLLDTPGQLRGSISQLSRLAPTFRTRSTGPASGSSSSIPPSTPSAATAAATAAAAAGTAAGLAAAPGTAQSMQSAASAASLMQLRKQMGLPAVPSSFTGEVLGPSREAVLSELVVLGRELLEEPQLQPAGEEAASPAPPAAAAGSGGAGGGSVPTGPIPAAAAGGGSGVGGVPPGATPAAAAVKGGGEVLADEVYLSAARQHLTSCSEAELRLRHLGLLWRDCQQLQQEAAGPQLLARLGEGLPKALRHLQGCGQLTGPPAALRLCEVGAVRSQYRHLVGLRAA